MTPTNPRTPASATASVPVRTPVHLDLRQDVALLTAALIDINSVSGNEGVLADAVEHALRQLPQLELVRDGDSIIARTNLGRAERVILAGHLDTVPLPTTEGSLGTATAGRNQARTSRSSSTTTRRSRP